MRRCAGRWGIRALSQQNCFMSPMLGEGFKMCFRFHSFALVCHSSDIFIVWTNYFDIHCICRSANANILAFGEVNGKENAKEMAKAEKKAKKRVKQRIAYWAVSSTAKYAISLVHNFLGLHSNRSKENCRGREEDLQGQSTGGNCNITK